MTMRRATAALLGTAVVPALVACGTDGGTEAASVVPTSASTTEAPGFPEGTARQTAENSGEWDLVLSDVRVGEHEGYDRIVLELTGTGTPGWTVNYVKKAVLDGSGKVVRVGGDAILDIYASGTTWPADDYYSGPRRFEPEDGGDVDEVYVAGTFEGCTQVLAGIEDDRVPFRVFTLSDPPRLVVDVRDNG